MRSDGLPKAPASLRKAIRESIVLLTLIGSLAVVIWGFAHSDVLNSQPWTPLMIEQAKSIGLATMCAVAFAGFVELRWRIRLEFSLAVACAIGLGLAYGAIPLVVVSAFLLSATALGTLFSARLRGTDALPLIFATSFGVAIYSIVFTLLGSVPINTFALHVTLLAAPLAVLGALPQARRELFVRIRGLSEAIRSPEIRSWIEWVGLIAFLFVALLHGLLAALPERYWDAMVMHLYIPSYTAANGRWSYDASLYAWAYMPAAVDWLYTHFFILNGEMATRLYNLAALMMLCAACHTILQRVVTREIAIWMVVLFASMPIAFLESASLFIENTLALFIISAAGIIFISGLRPNTRHVMIALTFLAAASMSKLHGALAAAVIGSVLLGLFIRQRPQAADITRSLAATVVLGALACFPYVFSWIKTGNPLFPYYNDVFKSEFFPTIPLNDTRWMGHFDWRLLYDATFFSGRYLEAWPGALGLTVILLMPVALVMLVVRPRPIVTMSLFFTLAIMLPILSQIQYIRYIYPVFPLVLIPAGVGIALLANWPATRLATFALLAAVTAFNVYKIQSAGWLLGHFDLRGVFNSEIRLALVLDQVPERLANGLINRSAGPATRVLYTGNPYGALLEGRALYAVWYNMKLEEMMANVTSDEQARALLTHWGVTHVVHTIGGERQGQKALGDYLTANYRAVARLGGILVYDLHSMDVPPSELAR